MATFTKSSDVRSRYVSREINNTGLGFLRVYGDEFGVLHVYDNGMNFKYPICIGEMGTASDFNDVIIGVDNIVIGTLYKFNKQIVNTI